MPAAITHWASACGTSPMKLHALHQLLPRSTLMTRKGAHFQTIKVPRKSVIRSIPSFFEVENSAPLSLQSKQLPLQNRSAPNSAPSLYLTTPLPACAKDSAARVLALESAKIGSPKAPKKFSAPMQCPGLNLMADLESSQHFLLLL